MEDTVNWTIAALRELLPHLCGVSCRRLEEPPEHLTAEEVGRAMEKGDARRSDFVAGRKAAHEALAQLDVYVATLPTGPRGEPLWPAGIVGSIAHAGGIAAAAAARSDTLFSLGLDIEITGAATSEMWADVLQPSEIAFVNSHPAESRGRLATAMFCTKEAFYKFQYPETKRWIEFKDVEVRLETELGRSMLSVNPGFKVGRRHCTEFPGRYRIGAAVTIATISCPVEFPSSAGLAPK